jgi:hypothetical protein
MAARFTRKGKEADPELEAGSILPRQQSTSSASHAFQAAVTRRRAGMDRVRNPAAMERAGSLSAWMLIPAARELHRHRFNPLKDRVFLAAASEMSIKGYE